MKRRGTFTTARDTDWKLGSAISRLRFCTSPITSMRATRWLGWLRNAKRHCEIGFRTRSPNSFAATAIGRFASLWRTAPTPGCAGDPVWDDLAALPQDAQEIVAAGFEFLGRWPANAIQTCEARTRPLYMARKDKDHAPPAVRSAASRGGVLRLVYISGEPDTPGHQYRVARSAAAAEALGAVTSWMRIEEIPDRLPEIRAASLLLIWRAPWDERVATAGRNAARSARWDAKIVFDRSATTQDVLDPERAAGRHRLWHTYPVADRRRRLRLCARAPDYVRRRSMHCDN